MISMEGDGNIRWVIVEIITAVVLIAGIWMFVHTGADRKAVRQRRGEQTVERYGDIEEDRAPTSKFLLWTYVGVAVWAVVYAVYTGINGFY